MALEEAALLEAHRESSEEAFEEASTSEAAILEEIIATTTTPGAEGKSDDGLPIANHLYEGSSASFLGDGQASQVVQGVTSSTRQNSLNFSISLA